MDNPSVFGAKYKNYLNLTTPIPITYYYNEEEHHIICYSGKGHKIDAMRKNTSVSLAVSEIFSNNKWQSVLAHGHFEEIDGGTAKLYLHEFSLGIKDIVIKKEHKELDYISEFSSKIYNMEIPIVFLIKIDDITGKARS